ncbi:MAG: galactose oxidase-like domain-containing protein [Pseudomonadota bacterium]
MYKYSGVISGVTCLLTYLFFSKITIAAQNTAFIGGLNGKPFQVDCGVNQVLAGIAGRSGVAIDQISAYCVNINTLGQWVGDPVPKGGSYGGSGGGPFINLCPRNYGVVGYTGDRTVDESTNPLFNLVASIRLQCQKLTSINSVSGPVITLPRQGVIQNEVVSHYCPKRSPAQGIRGNYDNYVNQYGLLCRETSDIYKTAVTAGSGGIAFSLDCGPGFVLAGISGRSGDAIDQVSAHCVEANEFGKWASSPQKKGGNYGGGGGAPFTSFCPQDQAVVGYSGTGAGFNPNDPWSKIVGSLQVHCRALSSSFTTQGPTTLNQIHGLSRNNFATHLCPINAPARGIFGRSSNLLDQYGLICTNTMLPTGPIPVNQPQLYGEWSNVINWPLIGIHSILTPQGEVLTFGTNDDGIQGAQYFYDLWTPALGTDQNAHYTLNNTLQVDSFCSAPLIIPESGNVLMPGGDARVGEGYNRGIVDAPIFDTINKNLSQAAPMQSSRWYPTATTLINGEILLTGGINAAGLPSITPEVYSPTQNKWRSLFNISTNEMNWFYPRQWVAPNGLVFGMSDQISYFLDANDLGKLTRVADLPNISHGSMSTASLFNTGKILSVGGNGELSGMGALIIDINNGVPVYTETRSMSFKRGFWANSTVLPNGEVFVNGGSTKENDLATSVLTGEIWNPTTQAWSLTANAQLGRFYHSSSLLLPDGRVLVAGGGAPGPLTNLNAELFSPPYLFDQTGKPKNNRLEILTATNQATYGQTIRVAHNQTQPVSKVTLIKTGATTHSTNMEQRFSQLNFTNLGGQLDIRLPANAQIASPGYYLLFLIDSQNTPSKGHILRLAPTTKIENSLSVGGNGGAPFQIDCGSNQVLAGIGGRSGDAIDQISAYCVNVNQTGQWTNNPLQKSGNFGGMGGGAFTSFCPKDHAVVGYVGSKGSADVNDWWFNIAGYVQLICQRLSSPNLTTGAISYATEHGLPRSQKTTIKCKDSFPAKGLYGRSSGLVDQYGLRCLTPF